MHVATLPTLDCAAAAVTAASVLHKMGSEPIFNGCRSGIMREVPWYIKMTQFLKIIGHFKIKIQIYLNFKIIEHFKKKIQINLIFKIIEHFKIKIQIYLIFKIIEHFKIKIQIYLIF